MEASLHRLDYWWSVVVNVVLDRQHPVTGLFPASTAVTAHGDYRDAWVRDNVYTILCVWGLARAYRRFGDNSIAVARAQLLEGATVKNMRAILICYMKQSDKVEKFKTTQHIHDCLHAKYNTANFETVVGDKEWGHLQLDATSIFLLMLAQMTSGGLRIILTIDEVAFVQNLVYYIERTYRTRDYGLWERGSKINNGEPELNSSSIGMATAALEAINGVQMFGTSGSSASTIRVMPDEIYRNRTTLSSLLPRESLSKEIDAALLSVIGYPAFAATPADVLTTRNEILSKLLGKYGCKRFLRDGHQTVVEDTSRLHYTPMELERFANIECEWPLFFTYLILDALFRGDKDEAIDYTQRLEKCAIVQRLPTGQEVKLVPELYYVPSEGISGERAKPGSQDRHPNENLPLVWAQSLYILSQLLLEEFLHPGDIDPIGRRFYSHRSGAQDVSVSSTGEHHLTVASVSTVIQVCLLSESVEVQADLRALGTVTQTIEEVEPIGWRTSDVLVSVLETSLGTSRKLGLTGRPPRSLGTLASCKVYRCGGKLYVFSPSFLDLGTSYLNSDTNLVIDVFKEELASVRDNWYQTLRTGMGGRPTLTLVVTQRMLFGVTESRNTVVSLVKAMQSGVDGMGGAFGVRIRLGRLQDLIQTASIESLDDFAGAREMLDNMDTVPDRGDSSFSRLHRSTSVLHASQSEIFLRDSFNNCDVDYNAFVSARESYVACVATDSNEVILRRLQACDNCYHQTFLLTEICERYVHNMKTIIGPSVTLRSLLHLMYIRACMSQAWYIVRMMAGLLRQSFLSLTSSVVSLHVRRVALVLGPYVIDGPRSPNDLHNMLLTFPSRDHAFVQELITDAAALARSDRSLFIGISRLKLDYLTRALIILLGTDDGNSNLATQSLDKDCDVFESFTDRLRHLSPFDLKQLIRRVLRTDFVCKLPAPLTTVKVETAKEIVITVQSAGYQDGNFACFKVDDSVIQKSSRGVHWVVVEGWTGAIVTIRSFDTHLDPNAVIDMQQFLSTLPSTVSGDRTLFVMAAVADEASSKLKVNAAAIAAVERFGSLRINELNYRDSWCMICVVNRSGGMLVTEHLSPWSTGATRELSHNLVTNHLIGADVIPSLVTASSDTASSRMLRSISVASTDALGHLNTDLYRLQRAIMGALHKSPATFFPRVWHLLTKCRDGIHIANFVLPRLPTVSEMTASEVAFALRVDVFLDDAASSSPIDRTLAIETLLAVCNFADAFPDVVTILDVNLCAIRRVAERMAWEHCAMEGHHDDGHNDRDGPLDHSHHTVESLTQSATYSDGDDVTAWGDISSVSHSSADNDLILLHFIRLSSVAAGEFLFLAAKKVLKTISRSKSS